MKLYDGGRAPNPRRVRIFLAEKGIKVPTEQVDLGALQQRTDSYTRNRSPFAVISRRCSPTRRFSAAARSRVHWSKCGTAAPNSTCFSRLQAYFSICIRP